MEKDLQAPAEFADGSEPNKLTASVDRPDKSANECFFRCSCVFLVFHFVHFSLFPFSNSTDEVHDHPDTEQAT